MRLIVGTVAMALALTLVPADSSAKERVRVATFKGKKSVKKVGKKVRSSVVKSIKKKHRVVKKDYKGSVKLAVRKQGRVYRVTIKLLDHAGDTNETFKFKATDKGLSKKDERTLAKELDKAIRRLPDAPEAEPEPEPEPEEVAAGDDDDDDTVAGASDDDDDDDNKPSVEKKARRSRRGGMDLPGGTVAAGLAVTQRRFGFGIADMGNYKGAAAGGAYVNATLFPLAIGDDAEGLKGKVGIGFVLENSIGLKSRFPGDSATLPTQMRRLGIDARYRMAFGDKKRPMTASVNVGYEQLSFNIDTSGVAAGVTVLVPDTKYASLTVGPSVNIPVTEKIAVGAEVHLKAIVGAGAIVTQAAYGGTAGSNLGFDVDANLEYGVTEAIRVIAGFQISQVSLKFNQTGDLSAMGEFAKSTDRYLGGYATAAYRFK